MNWRLLYLLSITFFKHFFQKSFPSALNKISKKALIIENIRFENWGILNNYSMSACWI